MKTFSVQIDERLDSVLSGLRESLGKTSRAEIFRLAIALLQLATEGRDKGLKLTLSNSEDEVVKEIVLP